MSVEAYKNGTNYEVFIRRAFKCDKQRRYGADCGIMQNYLNNSSNTKAYDQLHKYIENAIDRFFKFKLNQQEKDELLKLKSMHQNHVDLMIIVNKGLDITIRHK